MPGTTVRDRLKRAVLAGAAGLLMLPAGQAPAQEAGQLPAPEAIQAPAPQPAKRQGRLPPDTEGVAAPDAGQATATQPDPMPAIWPAEGASPAVSVPAAGGTATDGKPAAADTDNARADSQAAGAAEIEPTEPSAQQAVVPAQPNAPADAAATAEQPAQSAAATPAAPTGPASAADQIADIFSKVGDQIYEECIFELSQEQVEVQFALMMAYLQQGATSSVATRLAAQQIQPPPLSETCEKLRRAPPEAATSSWQTTLAVPKAPPAAPAPAAKASPKDAPEKPAPAQAAALAGKKGLPQWDCAPNVDFVTIKLNGYERKLTGGEICNPYQDVVREVPASVASFRLGYTIRTGRLFVVSDDGQANGQTIAWAISGRDVCRNNPDPDCFAARAVGPLPPGEYSFSGEPERRVSWGPKTKRHVAGIYLKKLWHKDLFSAQQKAAVLARGNIAIHVRLKGEMSEACLGLEPKGWAYVARLIKEGRATGVNVYIDEPHPQIAEAPPVVVASSFSLTSLFK